MPGSLLAVYCSRLARQTLQVQSRTMTDSYDEHSDISQLMSEVSTRLRLVKPKGQHIPVGYLHATFHAG
jgi:hypothetical protein